MPRRTVGGRSSLNRSSTPRFAEPIKALIEDSPSFGYRTVPHLLELNKETVQRIFQLIG